ncbi:WSCD family member CG9164-like [Haliotis cracherodii]|uniref:WSCD family member CG9164-like n=1 Tax=Haliotis cracherodii TaxID=6455 RepID=UPI0039E9FE0C
MVTRCTYCRKHKMGTSSLKREFVGCVIFMVFSTIWLVSYTDNTTLINMKTRVASSSVLLPSVAKKDIECPKVSLSKKPLPLTVLVSFPGSGNTWTRHLLEQMTGIATGSDFFDKNLEAGGFLGESKMNGSTIAVKTHDLYKPQSRKPLRDIKRAILIIRNPYNAMVADFNRHHSKSHVGIVALPVYIKNWNRHLSEWSRIWYSLNHSWITQMDNLLVIFYENLQKHLEQELTRLYSFLDDGSFHGNIQCALNNTEGNFHRNTSNNLPISFFYGDPDVRLMNRYIDVVDILLKKYNHSFFDISSYKMKLGYIHA